jgi:hypothetical protein
MMSKRVTVGNTLFRAQRELKMARNIVIFVTGITTVGFPYALFVFISLFTSPPRYHFRIAYIFVHAAFTFVIIATLKFTEPIKNFMMKKFNRRPNVVVPTNK